MTITSGSALSKEDIDRMVKEAEEYAEDDRKRRESVEVRNQADSLVYSTEKFLSENDDKLADDIKTEVRADLDALKKTLEGEDADTEAITAAITKLGQSSQKMGAAMYESAGAEAGSASSGESAEASGDSEEVVDAEIVDEGDAEGDEGKDK
jgi:molecular chaperone DnaK